MSIPIIHAHGLDHIEQIGPDIEFRFFRKHRSLICGTPGFIFRPALSLIVPIVWVRRNIIQSAEALEQTCDFGETIH